MPPGSSCATARTAPCLTLAARPAPSRPPSAGRSQPGARRAASPGAAAATATPTTCATGRPAVRPGSVTSCCSVGVTTGPSTRKDSRSSCGMTATPASSGLTVNRFPRHRRPRAGLELRWNRAPLTCPPPASRSTGTRRPPIGTGNASTWSGPLTCSVRPDRACHVMRATWLPLSPGFAWRNSRGNVFEDATRSGTRRRAFVNLALPSSYLLPRGERLRAAHIGQRTRARQLAGGNECV